MIRLNIHGAQPIGSLEVAAATVTIGEPLPAEVHGDGLGHMMQHDANRLASLIRVQGINEP